jgi:preprotein translocase SecE subunit
MAVDVARTGGGEHKQSWFVKLSEWVHSLPGSYRAVMNEMRRVTWPSIEEVRQLSVMVVVLSLFIGGVISLMDVTFQAILVRWIPQIFAH